MDQLTDTEKQLVASALRSDAGRRQHLASKIDGGGARNDTDQQSATAWNLRDEARELKRIAGMFATSGADS